MSSKDDKKSRKKERERELRNDGLVKVGGVDFSQVMDRQVGDKRFERERAEREQGISSLRHGQTASSSTFDAFVRMSAGLEGKTLAEKIADPNRPTWEQYKKDNEDKLDMTGGEMRKMIEYRAQLDRERERKLGQNAAQSSKKRDYAISSDESSDDSDESSDSSDKKKKKNKKEKKEQKNKKQKRDREGSGDEPVRLSDFLREGGSNSD